MSIVWTRVQNLAYTGPRHGFKTWQAKMPCKSPDVMQESCSPTCCMSCYDRRAAQNTQIIPKSNEGFAWFSHAEPWNIPGDYTKEGQNGCLDCSALLFCFTAEHPREFLATASGMGLPCSCDPVYQCQEADASLHLGAQCSSLPSACPWIILHPTNFISPFLTDWST